MNNELIISDDIKIEDLIFEIRGKQVMFLTYNGIIIRSIFKVTICDLKQK